MAILRTDLQQSALWCGALLTVVVLTTAACVPLAAHDVGIQMDDVESCRSQLKADEDMRQVFEASVKETLDKYGKTEEAEAACLVEDQLYPDGWSCREELRLLQDGLAKDLDELESSSRGPTLLCLAVVWEAENKARRAWSAYQLYAKETSSSLARIQALIHALSVDTVGRFGKELWLEEYGVVLDAIEEYRHTYGEDPDVVACYEQMREFVVMDIDYFTMSGPHQTRAAYLFVAFYFDRFSEAEDNPRFLLIRAKQLLGMTADLGPLTLERATEAERLLLRLLELAPTGRYSEEAYEVLEETQYEIKYLSEEQRE